MASLTIEKSRWPGPVDCSARGGVSSIPAGRDEFPDRTIARIEADADELAVHLHVLDFAVGLEQRPQPGLVDAGNEKVLVGVRQPEDLVSDGTADHVGVDPERANVVADRGRHEGILPADGRGCASPLDVGDRFDLDECT